MRSENGISMILLIIIVAITGVAIYMGINYWINYEDNQEREDIKSEMLAIQSIITHIKNRNIVDPENYPLIGAKMDVNSNETEYKISDELKASILTVENADTYILSKEELENQGIKDIEINNEKFYIVDYNQEEIFYSLGIEGQYKLSEMQVAE